jgi:hypothetical protein
LYSASEKRGGTIASPVPCTISTGAGTLAILSSVANFCVTSQSTGSHEGASAFAISGSDVKPPSMMSPPMPSATPLVTASSVATAVPSEWP